MKAMARLIDADIALDNIDEWLDTVGTALIGRGLSYYAELQGCIEDAPTVDAVPVVRCKDCKHHHWEQEPCRGKTEHYCALHKGLVPVERDTFCSYGERITDGD